MPRRAVEASLRLFALATLVAARLAAAALADEPAVPQSPPAVQSLHERIDALVEAAAAGPLAAPASDADFLRRAYLDLNGTIPDAAVVRTFLDDPSPAKRQALVDRLLERPQFARHMARVFDVMLLERRAEKSVTAAEWHEYLRQGFAARKPLDQLCREILAADGSDGPLRPAASFYLDRDGDSNLLARDIGRLFFGHDLQCAQCHDHPLISDYLQSEYYGLLAFVGRGVLFVDAKAKKSYYPENADGEVNYKSVFTGETRDHVVPKVPGGSPISEPLLTKEEQYVVAPAKEVRGVPKYSRRAQLAAVATSGTSAAFNRNWANRLWAQMMGRGLVHPLDMQHSEKPQRAIATAGTAGRRTGAHEIRHASVPERIGADADLCAHERGGAAGRVEVRRGNGRRGAGRGRGRVRTLKGRASGAGDGQQCGFDGARRGVRKVFAGRHGARRGSKGSWRREEGLRRRLGCAGHRDQGRGRKEEVQKTLIEARDKAQAAVAKLPDDKPLAEAAGIFRSRVETLDGQLATARKLVADKTAEVQAASLKLAEADKTAQPVAAALTLARGPLDAADAASREAFEKHRAAKARLAELTALAADLRTAIAAQTQVAAATSSRLAAQAAADALAAAKMQGTVTAEQTAALESAAKTAAEKADADGAALDAAAAAVVDRSTARFALAPLKPLSPEQLAWATMQSVGLVDQQLAALGEQAKKDTEAAANVAPDARPAYLERLIEERVDEKLRGNLPTFVSLFGQQPGQAATFQPTVQQALFLANGGVVNGWLNPGGNNLTERLTKLEDPKTVAEELYLSVLTRRPTLDELAQVAAEWEAGKADRATTARELAWSLLVSTEFRFNH